VLTLKPTEVLMSPQWNALINLLLAASVLILVLGLVKPRMVLRGDKLERTRGRVLLSYGLMTLLLVMLKLRMTHII